MRDINLRVGQEWTMAYIRGEFWWAKRQPYAPYPVLWLRETDLANTYVPTDRDFQEQKT